jgi:2-dehydro-3-deoxyphosphooctonate aldolase (KDO 8-P synthase)
MSSAREATLLGRPLPPDRPFVIAGPCVLEGLEMALEVAQELRDACAARGLPFLFKASYAKANRTRAASPAGPGLREGLQILETVRSRLGVDLLTDVHCREEAPVAARVVQVLQVPAFLCRQTPLLEACARAAATINVKKGQFMAPEDMAGAVEKIRRVRPDAEVLVTERGTTFGYHNLVVDMRSFQILGELPVVAVFDVTHSLQHPGRGGDRRFARTLARAALAAGARGLFLETHPEPERALSDPTTQIPLAEVPGYLDEWVRLFQVVRSLGGA